MTFILGYVKDLLHKIEGLIMSYTLIKGESGGLIKAWIKGVPLEEQAAKQLNNVASMPFIFKHVAVMPDVHWGVGATVGSVISTKKAIIPAAVGVDIGCGMTAVKTTIKANDLPDSLLSIRLMLESLIPVGNSWHKEMPSESFYPKMTFLPEYMKLIDSYPQIRNKICPSLQLGTLGGGNHFIELCLDGDNYLWIMLHSGSRGMGNSIGRFFIEKAKEEIQKHKIELPDNDLSYFTDTSPLFYDYLNAISMAQNYAYFNRQEMLSQIISCLSRYFNFSITNAVIDCHHNYVKIENHFNEECFVTRKGAVSAKKDELGIIPSSMGGKSFIVRGLGNEESFCSCSHGAGRVMSRSMAKKIIDIEDHKADTEGVECRKDVGVLDESPRAYKNIDDVMRAQSDLVEIVTTIKQILCIKG